MTDEVALLKAIICYHVVIPFYILSDKSSDYSQSHMQASANY